MAKKKKIKSINWSFNEYAKQDRSRAWYFWTILVGAAIVLYALLTSNWLFALIIVMIGIIIIINYQQKPRQIEFEINHKGIKVNDVNYEYNQLSKFWIIYQPPKVKNLYFDFKSPFKPRLLIPLGKENPIQIKSFLRNYLEEDIDQEQEPFSEALGRMLKM
jgi:hypothetical protein